MSDAGAEYLPSIDGVAFEEAWPEREEVPMYGLTVPVLSRQHPIRNKRATDRPQDRVDVERLARGDS